MRKNSQIWDSKRPNALGRMHETPQECVKTAHDGAARSVCGDASRLAGDPAGNTQVTFLRPSRRPEYTLGRTLTCLNLLSGGRRTRVAPSTRSATCRAVSSRARHGVRRRTEERP